MGGARLTEILIYPVKSLGGDAHGMAGVQPWGLDGDRRWMVVDRAGGFLTQRAYPGMAVLHARAQGAGLTLSAPGMAALTLAPEAGGQPCVVRVWRDSVMATDMGEAASSWLSDAIGVPCRLAHLADTAARKLRPEDARHDGESVSFADGFPVLLASAESLADLNTRLAAPIPMSRFRPNLVVSGAAGWEEDRWRRLRIGGVVFRVAKPCDRCVMTTIDQGTGLKPDPKEPLRALAGFRRDASGGVMFGQNLVPEHAGHIAVGDAVEVLSWGEPNVVVRS